MVFSNKATFLLNNNQTHYAEKTATGYTIESNTALGANTYSWNYNFM
jgi:hypothetical protein